MRPRVKRRSIISRETSVATRVLLYAVLFGFTIMTLYPILWLVMSSCKTTQEFQLNRLGFPRGIHLDNFVQAWRIGGFDTLFLNSVFYTGISTIVVVVFSLAGGICFREAEIKSHPFSPRQLHSRHLAYPSIHNDPSLFDEYRDRPV